MAKVFIVDDEPSYRDSLDLILSHAGYEVRTAADGVTALEAAHGFLPDVLVVDWVLPGNTSGLDVAEAMLASNPDLRTIVITGYVTPQLVAQVKAINGAEVLAKPFGVDELLAAVERAVNGEQGFIGSD